jgi:hypothetical protein
VIRTFFSFAIQMRQGDERLHSAVGAAPNQTQISDQIPRRVSSTTREIPHQSSFSCDALDGDGTKAGDSVGVVIKQ